MKFCSLWLDSVGCQISRMSHFLRESHHHTHSSKLHKHAVLGYSCVTHTSRWVSESMKRASLLAVLFAAVVGHVDATEKALNELSTDDLLSLLRLWKLEAAFSKGFKANDYDGDVLEHLVDVDIPNDLPSLQPKFPRADVMQWKKLQKKVRALVEAGGVVDLSILDNVESEPADEASRRRLDVDAGDFGGIQIRKNNAMVAMGPAGDVALLRQGNASLHVSGDAVSFAADAVSFSGRESFEVNGTDLLQCCQDSQSADNETLTTVRQLKAEQLSIIDSVRILKQELFYLEKRFNASCTSVDEGTYSCNSVVSDYHDECIEEISSDTYIW